MPKDDSTLCAHTTDVGTGLSEDNNGDASHKSPLKRGDACLYCRRRRIRCSAEKPACQHCKNKRECVYDAGKPVSRVKQLEDKVAELEELLKTGPSSSKSKESIGTKQSNHNGSSDSSTDPSPIPHRSSSGATRSTTTASQSTASQLPNPSIESSNTAYSFGDSNATFDINMNSNVGTPHFNFGDQSYFSGLVGSMLTAPTTNPGMPSQPTHAQQSMEGPSRIQQSAVDMFDFNTLDPSFMNLVNSFGATSTTGLPPPPFNQPAPSSQSGGMMDMDGFDPSSNTVSTGLTPFLDPSVGATPLPQQSRPPPHTSSLNASPGLSSVPSSGPYFISVQPTPEPAAESVSYHAYVSEVQETPGSNANKSTSSDTFGTSTKLGYDRIREQNLGVTGAHPTPDSSTPQTYHSQSTGDGCRQWSVDPVVPESGENMGMIGGWFDASDIPRVARDHLLDLFFSGMKMLGQQFHIPRFFASLSLQPAKRPHPCLLYSMYLMASRMSSSIPICSLESHFYSIASTKLEESIAQADRLFDAVRAATILAVYKYSLARYHEGFMMTGQAARLAISCGLHAIPSSVYKPSTLPKDHRADLIGLMRMPTWVLPPPEDAIALGERIWSFWSIYITDRAGSISAQWPPCIPDDMVITPYPRPLYEYELGLVSNADDMSLSSLYDPTPRRPLPFYADSTAINLRARSIAICERASKLVYTKPEPGWADRLRESSSSSPPSAPSSNGWSPPGWTDPILSYEQYIVLVGRSPDGLYGQERWRGSGEAVSATATSVKGWMRTARIRTPEAYEEVLTALKRIEDDLPPERRTNWEVWDGKVQNWHFGGGAKKDLFTLHFVIGCAWMFLFDVFSFNAPNEKAVNVARRLAFTVKLVMNEQMSSDLDIFIAMVWSFITKILIREVKRLQSLDENTLAAPIEAEVEIVVQALKNFGSRYSIAQYQARRAEQYRKTTHEDMKFMENEDLVDDHKPIPAHPPKL